MNTMGTTHPLFTPLTASECYSTAIAQQATNKQASKDMVDMQLRKGEVTPLTDINALAFMLTVSHTHPPVLIHSHSFSQDSEHGL